MADKLESFVARLEKLIQEKLLNSEEFHDICNEMKDEEYNIDMGIVALLMDYKEEEKGFISFPFYIEFKEERENTIVQMSLNEDDQNFLKDIGISY